MSRLGGVPTQAHEAGQPRRALRRRRCSAPAASLGSLSGARETGSTPEVLSLPTEHAEVGVLEVIVILESVTHQAVEPDVSKPDESEP